MFSGVNGKNKEFTSLITKISEHKNFVIIKNLKDIDEYISKNNSIFGNNQVDLVTGNLFIIKYLKHTLKYLSLIHI